MADLLAKYELLVVLEARATLPQHICNTLNEDKERAEDYIRTFFHLPLENQASSSSHSHGESSSHSHRRGRKLFIRTKNHMQLLASIIMRRALVAVIP